MGQSSSSSIPSSIRDESEDWIDFNSSGPVHFDFGAIDWANRAHQRVVTSILINALYVYVKDVEVGRHATNPRAPRWWSFPGFVLEEPLIDTTDTCPTTPCFGAVFRRKNTASTSGPAIVIAIRGAHTARDLDVAIKAMFGILGTRTCFGVVMQALGKYTQLYPHDRIWLCGHSVGATIATGAGQEMAKKGISLTTFLFNPPTDLDPTTKNLFVEDLSKAMFGMIQGALNLGTLGFVAVGAGFAVYHSVKAVVGHIKREMGDEELYQRMTSWVPVIFVNWEDFFCQKYIKYFENRRIKSPPYLPKRIASAVLVRNLDARASTFPQSHAIAQWWAEDLHVQAELCHVGNGPRILDHTKY